MKRCYKMLILNSINKLNKNYKINYLYSVISSVFSDECEIWIKGIILNLTCVLRSYQLKIIEKNNLYLLMWG